MVRQMLIGSGLSITSVWQIPVWIEQTLKNKYTNKVPFIFIPQIVRLAADGLVAGFGLVVVIFGLGVTFGFATGFVATFLISGLAVGFCVAGLAIARAAFKW